MLFDDCAAAHVPFEREKLGEEAGREEAGVTAHAVMPERYDVLAVR